MTAFVTSLDGTRIAFDRLGRLDAPPLIIISGMFCDRETTRDLALQLAADFSVINFDRRGRGESGDTPPYTVKREIEDVAALISQAGGKAAIYGHSSGAGLALEAAARGLCITRLVLHEPPYGGDDVESREGARALAVSVREALDQDRPADAVRLFFDASGMPEEMAAELAGDPKRIRLAATMTNDFAVMGDFTRGGVVPIELVHRIGIPTLVMAGSESPEFFMESASRIAQLLPDGELVVVDGADHGAPADLVAPVVARFLAVANR